MQNRKLNLNEASHKWSAMSPEERVAIKTENVNSEIIPYNQATSMVEEFNTQTSNIDVPVYWYFDKEDIDYLLAQTRNGHQGEAIRFYAGIRNESGQPTLALIAVTIYADNGFDSNDVMYDFTTTCPPKCPTGSASNYESFDHTNIYRCYQFSNSEVSDCLTGNANYLRIASSRNNNNYLTLSLCGVYSPDDSMTAQTVENCTTNAPIETPQGTTLPPDDFPIN